jgi:hypothetical protein
MNKEVMGGLGARIRSWIDVLFYEQAPARMRHAKRAAPATPERRLRSQVTTTLISLPWLAVGALLWMVTAGESGTAQSALNYGLMKVTFAVAMTWIADWSLFWHVSKANAAPMAQVRRAMVFLGICWLMSVA